MKVFFKFIVQNLNLINKNYMVVFNYINTSRILYNIPAGRFDDSKLTSA